MTKLFLEITSEYEHLYFQSFPELALQFHRPDAILDQFTNYSIEAILQWQQEEDQFILALQDIDIKGMESIS